MTMDKGIGTLFVATTMLLLSVTILAFKYHETFIGERSLCPTRNMSYDIRGDPLIQSRTEYAFNNSEIGPLDPELCNYSPDLQMVR